ncbi:dihydroorotate dehydrogenase electron transfer subunit [Euzebya tangerina]|uniref:dihydroorotate dehydrogenase electron transfer subunit n=1 Tax=Euzebya tangerina TaxID=591198 RepID=UPI000E317CFC|nr:dihydroorotate dehydrogenase electron transfer subunit [Euzebya tangerina]
MSSFITRTGATRTARGQGPAFQGRDHGPLREQCEVLQYRKIGRYHSLTFVSPEMADRAKPGQFVSIGVEGKHTVLRRPFSIYQVSRHGPWAGTVEIIFTEQGEGTRWLTTRAKHDLVDLVGPLGTPFPIPQQHVTSLLVGAGYGTATLLYLAGVLQTKGLRADMIIGAKTADDIFNAIEAKRLSATTVFTTEDGSLGEEGKVTDVMVRMLESGRTGLVYASGPMHVLREVSLLATSHNVPVRVATEEAMACGTGVCQTCVLPVERKGQLYNLRGCVEGPVFNGAKVRWDAIGALPVMDVPEHPEWAAPDPDALP